MEKRQRVERSAKEPWEFERRAIAVKDCVGDGVNKCGVWEQRGSIVEYILERVSKKAKRPRVETAVFVDHKSHLVVEHIVAEKKPLEELQLCQLLDTFAC